MQWTTQRHHKSLSINGQRYVLGRSEIIIHNTDKLNRLPPSYAMMSLWRIDLSVLTNLSFPKLVLGISYMLESIWGFILYHDMIVLPCCFVRFIIISCSGRIFSTWSCFLDFVYCLVLCCKAPQYVVLLQLKHQNVWLLWRFCLLSLNPIFFLGKLLLCGPVSHQGWVQIMSLSSEMWALMLKDSVHWLNAVTVLIMPKTPPPFPNFIKTSQGFVCIYCIEVCPAHFHYPVYILDWAFGFWDLVQVLWNSWGVWPWYFPVIQVPEE